MSLLLLLQNAPTGGQTWTGNAGTITIAGTSGTFTSSTQWTGNAGTITIAGTSGTFTGTAIWNGGSGTVLIVGDSRGFEGATTSTGAAHGGDYHPISFTYPRPDEDQLPLILALI